MIVFTNGCFDLLHPGHVELLRQAKALGARLIVGINSDSSVRSIKGPNRPINTQEDRKAVLMGLTSVDEVVVFDEPTPERLIREVRPDILVKGGDWKIDQIVGSSFVLGYGGQVKTLPILPGYSTSSTVERLQTPPAESAPAEEDLLERSVSQHLAVFSSLVAACGTAIVTSGKLLIDTFGARGKVLICGNGGSAADAQHIAAEFVGRYETERRALPAIAITTDTSSLTAITNDYEFERVFSRQVDALAVSGDCLIAISTSGNSPNILSAVMTARDRGCRVISLTGAKGTKLAGLSDVSVMVPSERTARIQEAHITIAHVWCEMVDEWLAKTNE